MVKKTMAAVVLMARAMPARAELRLPNIVSDNMVLQREAKVAIWGWADDSITAGVGAKDRRRQTHPARR